MTDKTGPDFPPFWSIPESELMAQLQAGPDGLAETEAIDRQERFRANRLKPKPRTGTFLLLSNQFRSPVILILLAAAILALFLHDRTQATIILAIVLVSGLLGFFQERGATDAVQRLLALVQLKARVRRRGAEREIPVEEVVPGDVVLLGAGDMVPADCRILEARDFYVDEAALTGETFPVEKSTGALPAAAALRQRLNSIFMGSHVASGSCRAVVVHTGRQTEFGRISEHLRLRPPENEFEHGVRRFGYFLMEVTLVLVFAIFAINVFLHRPALDSFLFALALAVGLTPQLLPAIISINLAHGARRMAAQKVIVKRLASIENFGSMNVLCSDKTGTLTEGTVRIRSALDIAGQESEKALFYAFLNSSFETGFPNPIDVAVRRHRKFDLAGWQKLDEVPWDFVRRRLSILARGRGLGAGGSREAPTLMITKGAFANVLEVCTRAETPSGELIPVGPVREQIERHAAELGDQGFRVLGIAYKNGLNRQDNPEPLLATITRADESDMVFLGYLVLFDPPKSGVAENIAALRRLGVELKIITGDNRRVAAFVGRQVGMPQARILTGPEIHNMSNDALRQQAPGIDLFAEVEPNHKERIVTALRRSGSVVGFLGDGINDASALHAADVGISVDSAVDVAKETADIVLLDKDLAVLCAGVQAGRATFANTLKYVFMATSANFGNMFSMAGASLFLPFLPLLPGQILLTNLLTDFPEMTIATDRVDPELVDVPRRWNVGFIRRFMILFGPLSSIFDFLTFGALLLILRAPTDVFRTGWFVESVISAAAAVLVVRSRRPFFRSPPGRYLLLATLLVMAATVILPYTPLGRFFGFVPLSGRALLLIAVIVLLYVVTAELVKRFFYRRTKF
jgi:Mg2+-importing ATPase